MLQEINPIIFEITDGLKIQWYGVSYLLCIIACLIFLTWLMRRHRYEMQVSNIIDYLIYTTIGAFVFSRVFYCIVVTPESFIQFKSEFPYWGFISLTEGGLSVHGALIGVVISNFIFSIQYRVSPIYLLDISALVASLSIVPLSLSQYVYSENYGKVIGLAQFNWGIKFPGEILTWPVLDIEKLNLLKTQLPQYFESVSVDTAIDKVIQAYYNQEPSVQNVLQNLLPDRFPTQIFNSLFSGLLIFLILFLIARKSRKPGVLFSLFTILFSFSNFVISFWTEVDPNVHFSLFGLYSTQYLSIIFFLVGCWLLFFYGNRFTLPHPGWSIGQNVKLHRK